MYITHHHQIAVIDACMAIEKMSIEVEECVTRCVGFYNESETRSIRQKQFDELTSMLGEGKEPTMGFTDWKARGVKGIRPLMVKFFLLVQVMFGTK